MTITQVNGRSAADTGRQIGIARVALIGLGGAADRILLPGLRTVPDVRVVAASDPDATARERARYRWRIPRLYEGPEEMLREEAPDVAIVATPPLTHRDLCLLALAHGCHVFCEKPFMPSVDAADEVIAASERARRAVAVNNQYSHMPIYRAVTRELDSGRPGRLYRIGVWQHMHLLPRDEGGWKAALAPRRVLYEFGTHALDLVCHFFRAYPVAVTARMPRACPDANADVCIVMRLDFPDDRVADFVINRVSHAPKKYIEMRLDCERASLRASLGGVATAQLNWNSLRRRPRFRLSVASGGEVRWESGGGSRLLARQGRSAFFTAARTNFEDFLASIRAGTEPSVSARHAREVLRVVFAGYESAAGGGGLVPLC